MQEELTNSILDKLDLFWEDLAYNKKTKICYGDLIFSTIKYGSMKESSKYLSISERTLERILPQTLGLILEKDSSNATRWDFTLLALIDIRPCWKCKQYRSISTEYYYNDRILCISCQTAFKREQRQQHPEKFAKIAHEHYINNKHDYIARSSSRKRIIHLATPMWADLDKIKEIYKNCPTGYHVDHIVPLQGKTVCGLHVENNLQYLTVQDNLSKGNSYYE